VDLWLVVEVNIALPLAIRILVRALTGDLLRADRDPLTGLLNRRAFQHNALGMIVARRGIDAHLVVMLIDLDNFKALNDNRGHAAGDRALVQVAQTLVAAADNQAVVARSGGEEFLLAGTSAACNAEALAARMCRAIAASAAEVTASIGTACARVGETTPGGHQSLLEELVTAADAAMYRAKRFGRQPVCSCGWRSSGSSALRLTNRTSWQFPLGVPRRDRQRIRRSLTATSMKSDGRRREHHSQRIRLGSSGDDRL
jgi:diguanylate cyclase (GGDEF)-like protein